MSNQQISQDKHDAYAEIFKIWKISLNSGKPYTIEEVERDEAHYLSIPIAEKSKTELDLDQVRSMTAQMRELRKEQESILSNNQKVVEALLLTKETHDKIYPQTNNQ